MMQSQSKKLDLLLERTEDNKSLLKTSLLIGAEQHPLFKPSAIAGLPLDIEQHSMAMSYKQLLPFFRGPSGMTFYISAVGMMGSGIESTDREAYSTLEGEIIIERDCENTQDNLNNQDIDNSSTPTTAKPQHGLLLNPLEKIDREVAVHLVHLYDSLVGVTHPILSIGDLMKSVRGLYPTLATESHSLVDDIFISQMGRSDLNIIKMVFAIAMAMEGSDHVDTAAKLYASIQHDVDNTIWAAIAEIGDLHVLILVVRMIYTLLKLALTLNRAYIIQSRATRDSPGVLLATLLV